MNEEIRQQTRVAAAGVCIYCGRTTDLTEEHVVPFALGGNLIVPDASCPDCADITSAVETRVLRGFMHDARIAGKFPTRHPKKRPTTVSIRAKKEFDIDFHEAQLPAPEAIGILFLPKLEPAAFLAGKPPVTGVHISGIQVIAFGKSPQAIAKSLDVKTLQVTANIQAHDFARMLAKIGYSYALASNGLYPRDEVPVLPLILGKSDDDSTWVGSADYQIGVEAKGPQHAIELVERTGTEGNETVKVLVARVKLFASSNATGYEIVVRKKVL